MGFLPSLGELTSRVVKTFKRFPGVLTWAVIGTLFILYLIETEQGEIGAYHLNYLLTAILGISWLIATRFFIEQFKSDKSWFLIGTILLLLMFYWHLPLDKAENRSITYWIRFVLYFIAGHLLVLVAPFIMKFEKETYWNYLREVFLSIFRSLLYSLVLFLGIVLALLAIKYLFNVNFNDRRYFEVFVICIGIVNTWIYLSDFPSDVHSKTNIDFIKALEVFVRYILIPLVMLYLAILYAYSIKIVVEWDLPKGWVSYLVTALAFLGFFIQLVIDPVQKKIGSTPVKKYQPWFYLLLLPLTILLFVAVFTRISAYGFTEKRYFVMILAFWILGMSLYMLLSKKKQVRWFLLSLAFLTLTVSFGPWGAFSVSTNSQIKEFKKLFTAIKQAQFKISSSENEQFNSIIDYLHNKKQLTKIAPALGFDPAKAFNENYGRAIAEKIADSLNFKITIEDIGSDDITNPLKMYHLDETNYAMDIKGYDNLISARFSDYDEREVQHLHFKLDGNNNNLIVSRNQQGATSISLDTLVKGLIDGTMQHQVPADRMTVISRKDSLDIKLIFREITILNNKKTSSGLPRIETASAYILLKANAQ